MTLGVVGGADEVGDRLGVFGGVGGLAVAADARKVEGGLYPGVSKGQLLSEGEAYRVAGVTVCGGGAVGELEANQRARCLLLFAPLVCGIVRFVSRDKDRKSYSE